MKFDISTEKERIYSSLSKAYEFLFKMAINSGNWSEVRCTALAGMCLRLREPLGSAWLEAIKKWLLEQQTELDENKASWGDELWDTCMALMALKRLGLSCNDPKFQKALNWIQSLYNRNRRNNWHDEPWETSWSLLAILETEPSGELLNIVYKSANWLMSLQDSDGKIVSPHYTGYFILVSDKLNSINEDEKHEFRESISKSTNYLFNNISGDTLWTGEPWSNGQILWTLTNTKRFPCDNSNLIRMVTSWFLNQQELDGSFSDIEDTSCAILGLYYLLRELESKGVSTNIELDTFMYNTLRRNLETPILCIKRPFIEQCIDGTTSINLSPKTKKLIALVAAFASGATVIIALWDFIMKFIER
jgi:hypothetical protein